MSLSSKALSITRNWSIVILDDCSDILDSMCIPIKAEERAKRPGDIPYYIANGLIGWNDNCIFANLSSQLDHRIEERKREMVTSIQQCWEKHRESLSIIDSERKASRDAFVRMIFALGHDETGCEEEK